MPFLYYLELKSIYLIMILFLLKEFYIWILYDIASSSSSVPLIPAQIDGQLFFSSN